MNIPKRLANMVRLGEQIALQNIPLVAGRLRSAIYLSQNLTLPLIGMLATGKQDLALRHNTEEIKKIVIEIDKLLKTDSKFFADSGLTITELKHFYSPPTLNGYFRVAKDAISVARRKDGNKNHDFSGSAKSLADQMPEYYNRNFHFQTDGYLSSESARLYEDQVEILFAGAANPMRRLLLPSIARFIQTYQNSDQNKKMHFLELGAGTGSLSYFVKMFFPQIQITLLDLSEPYLNEARSNLERFSGLNYSQGDATALPFKDQHFDGVFSCFLFHELPQTTRHEVMKESYRVLKNKGFLGAVDAIQNGDSQELQPSVDRFPTDFHEPFFRNYAQHDLQELMTENGFTIGESSQGFFSKAVTATK